MNLRTRVSALALTGLLAATLAACGNDDDPTPVASDPGPGTTDTSTPTETSAPVETDTAAPPSSDGGEPGTVAAPIYFVGDSPMGPRLYREFREVESDNPAEEALALLIAGDTLDPDYGTLLPSIDVSSVTIDPDAIVLDLGTDSTTADKSISAEDGALAVQSLVYTLQGIAQERLPLQITVGGVPTPFLGQPTDTGVDAADQLDVLSLVSITTPESDATVSGSFTASGAASSFEATVPWELRDEAGEVVLDGFATAEEFSEELSPWSTEIDLGDVAPGTYTFAALTDDPSDGEGPGPFEDTKVVTVE